jgi:hypothetical protein
VTAPDIVVALGAVVDALEGLGVRYHVGGSVASSAQGIARSTLDVDIVADLRESHALRLAELLEGDFYVDAEMIRDAVRRESSFNVIHLATMMKVDVFAIKARPYSRQAFERMQTASLEDRDGAREFYLCAPEDTILAKLEWFEMGGEVARRQWDDALGVVEVQGDSLDRDYLEHWAADLGLRHLLERLLAAAGRS